MSTPYILLGRKRLAPERAPSSDQVYDEDRQLWIDKASGLPVVCCIQSQGQATQFGETTFTATREGTDRTEGASLEASEFGETAQTRTREGVDQNESAIIQASQLGETTLTKTQEGADQAERTATQAVFDASHSHF